jgi:hypothetical protein
MARLTFTSPITSIKGSIGSTTFQQNASGYIARLRPNRITTQIKNPLSKFISLSKRLHEWQALSPTTQALWKTFAVTNSKIDYFGNTKKLTGYNWYVSINNYLETLGISILSSPPVYVSPTLVPAFTFQVNDLGPMLFATTPYNLNNNYLLIFATPPITSVFNIQRSKFRFITYSTTSPVTNINFKTDWQNKFNTTYPSAASLYRLGIACMIFHVNVITGIASQANFYYDGTDTNQVGGIGNMVIGNNFIIQ